MGVLTKQEEPLFCLPSFIFLPVFPSGSFILHISFFSLSSLLASVAICTLSLGVGLLPLCVCVCVMYVLGLGVTTVLPLCPQLINHV